MNALLPLSPTPERGYERGAQRVFRRRTSGSSWRPGNVTYSLSGELMGVAEQHLSGKAARATFALLGLSAAGVGLAGGVVSLRVYQLARRPRGIWGSDQPPDGLTENVVFPATDGTRLSGWFLRASAFQHSRTERRRT
jgi:hypothetical protein